MGISERKMRERTMREALILDHADRLFQEAGYLGLHLDQLAARIEYSKATIYNHFASKEDLVLAICRRHIRQRAEFFGRALTFDGLSRERMFVIGLADLMIARLHPHAFAMFQLAQSPSIWEKVDPLARKQFGAALISCMKPVREIVRQARSQGDLGEHAPGDDQILFGFVSMSKGALLLHSRPTIHHQMFGRQAGSALDLLKANYHAFLDGVGWRPFSVDWDFAGTEQRIYTELFPEENRLRETTATC